MPEQRTERNKALWVLALFALVHGLVSFPNHALFRTYALDLGLYTHALWHYAHGGIHDSSLFLEQQQSILADHFDLYLPLLSPLVFVLGTWTLLLVQWVSVLFGAWGVRLLLRERGLSASDALTGMVLMLLFFGVFSAMAFDYHSNVVSAMLLPWFLLALQRERNVVAILVFVIMLMGKESMGFWLGPVALIVAFDRALAMRMRGLAAVLGAVGLLWSIVVIGLVMPALSHEGAYAHFDYALLGNSVADAPAALVQRPVELLKALFMDPGAVVQGTEIKVEFWLMLLAAGGWALVLRPRWGLMALPLLAQKMWHDDPGKWSVIAQYGVEFAPLIGIAAPIAWAGLPCRSARALPWIAIALSLACTIRFMDRTVAYHDRSRIRIYQVQHYTKSYDAWAVHRALDRIPMDAAVSAQSPAVPHLALRPRVYQYPIVKDASFIVILPQESPYPLDPAAYRNKIDELRLDAEWALFWKTDGCVIFQRRGEDGLN